MAMQDEMKSLQENGTYELVELPKGRKALKNKWVFKLKRDGNGEVMKHKARLVVKGFGQKQGIDFEEIFSPVVKMTSIRTVLGLVAGLNLELEQLDVKTAFLHGDLEEEIYMVQPEGFEVKGKEHKVCRLRKSLYGLKQAPRQWYKKFDSFMTSHGYQRFKADPCVYFKRFTNGKFLILLLYVDAMLVTGQDAQMIAMLKKELSKAFDMKDMGQARQILGMQITRDRKAKRLWLSQEKYVERVLERFNMKGAKTVSCPLPSHLKLSKKLCPSTEKEKDEMSRVPYSSAVGSLMYAMVCIRPDIAYAVGVVSRFLSNPGKQHWEAVKWILRYLKGTSKLCLSFGKGEPVLEGYTDADMAGDLDHRKSTSGGAVSWQSKLQKCVALSTTEAEYIAATEAGKEL
ncbi:Retrovirus-related Pol polyprotein from transposon TNT 1-94-like protein, partial [Drosera capensis]